MSNARALHHAATAYHEAGLCALPAKRAEKRPAVGAWKRYQDVPPTEAELSAWFANGPDAVCILCGKASGQLEIIDFDAGGERFASWWERITPDLRERLVVESTPSGGRHVIYRSAGAICGNMKLAQRLDGDELVTLIETRGEGGLFLCAPTEGYEVVQGDLGNPPVLSDAERDVLLQAAWELNEYTPPVVNGPSSSNRSGNDPELSDSSVRPDRPGDDFNARGDVRAVLEAHGWQCVRQAENEYWRRPGKAGGWSASLKDGVFYVFSSSAAPFEPNRAYAPFAVYTLLEHGGDYAEAARALRTEGYGEVGYAGAMDVDLSKICDTSVPDDDEPAVTLEDPGPLPDSLLYVPGFIGELMDHCLATAPYPNRVMAFCGALAMQAFLAGRKVRDCNNNRTNLYLLGLAHSAAGKDHPRKLNTLLAHEVGLTDCLGDKFASGEGVQDALYTTPCMLFQTDEIDGMLQSINKAKDARHENIMGTLLTLYSAANSVFPMRRKAGKEAPGAIDQPNLVIFGTAIPNHYYEALSSRMLSNGFFARMVILESGPRGKGQEPEMLELPERVVQTAKWWAAFQPDDGNLHSEHPKPALIKRTAAAQKIIEETRELADAEWDKAHEANDQAMTTVWGRVSEQTRKLALLYAISENPHAPEITDAAAQWASAFVLHQTRRMLFMASSHVAENPFHADCLKVMQKLREAPGQSLPHSVLLKRMKIGAKHFQDLVETLVQRGDIDLIVETRKGSAKKAYRLLGEG